MPVHLSVELQMLQKRNADPSIAFRVYKYEALRLVFPMHGLSTHLVCKCDQETEKKIAMKWKFIWTAQVHEIFDFRRGYYISPLQIETQRVARRWQWH